MRDSTREYGHFGKLEWLTRMISVELSAQEIYRSIFFSFGRHCAGEVLDRSLEL